MTTTGPSQAPATNPPAVESESKSQQERGRAGVFDAQAQLTDYEEHHRSAANKWTHYFGIPLIVIGIINFLWHVPLVAVTEGYTLTLAEPVILLFAGFYAFMHVGMGAAMLGFFAILFGLAVLIGNIWIALGLFVGGWILQFVGHGVFEKRSPAFTKNLLHLLIGPMWIVNNALGKVGIRVIRPA